MPTKGYKRGVELVGKRAFLGNTMSGTQIGPFDGFCGLVWSGSINFTIFGYVVDHNDIDEHGTCF